MIEEDVLLHGLDPSGPPATDHRITLSAGARAAALIGHTGATGSWVFRSLEADLYLAGTFDNLRAAGAPYRIVPALVRAHSDERG